MKLIAKNICCASQGDARVEALRNIQEVTQMVVEALIEDGEPLPEAVVVTEQPTVAVNV